MDKVVCINISNNDQPLALTYGKVYEVLKMIFYEREEVLKPFRICVYNDVGNDEYYAGYRFVTLKEWRKMKLKKIEANEIRTWR